MGNAMRSIYLLGSAAMLLAAGAIDAHPSPIDHGGSPHAIRQRHHERSSYRAVPAATQEGRASYSQGDDLRALGDELRRRPTDSGYHDPAFSLQQDEIYNGRF